MNAEAEMLSYIYFSRGRASLMASPHRYELEESHVSFSFESHGLYNLESCVDEE